jgi:hypothetical protein
MNDRFERVSGDHYIRFLDPDGWGGGYASFGSAADVTGMMFPVRATCCGQVYDLAAVKDAQNYADCSVWRCPGCETSVSSRRGSPDCKYVELDHDGLPRRDRR